VQRVVCATEPGRYMVSFAVKVDAPNRQATQKVEREQHFFVCGSTGTPLCGRCSRKWYCSKICQFSDHKTHEAICKALALKDVIDFGNYVER
jgi:hypothetical protein